MLTLVLTPVFIWRIRGSTWATAIGALMAFAPTQLHMSQHALVDGFFTFWAMLVLWLFWENLQSAQTITSLPSPQSSPSARGSREAIGDGEIKGVPANWPWLIGYVAALALLLLTKENSVFVWISLVALLIANRWFQFGTVTRELVIATILGPLLGVVVLIFLAGGFAELFHTYQLSVSKNLHLRYAVLTGDGPWYRYLVDLLLVSPIVLILALGAVFNLTRAKKVEWFFLIFIAATRRLFQG